VLSKKVTLVILGLGMVATFALATVVAGVFVASATCFVLLLSALLARRTCHILDLRHVSITSFWYLSYLAMIFFPAFLVYYFQGGPYRDGYLFAVESVLLTMPLGWRLATWSGAFNREEIKGFYQAELVEGPASGSLMLRCWLLLLVCLALVFAYVREAKTIPLLYLIRNPGDAIEVAFLREEALKTLDSRLTYFYYLVRGTLYPLLIAVAMGAYLEFRNKMWFFTLAVSFTTGLIFAALTVAKSPVALIILVTSIFYYVHQHGRLSRKAIAVLLILVFLFPIAVLAYASHSDSVTSAMILGAIAYRLFYLPAEVVYYYFEIFPSHIPFLHGRGTDKFAKLLGLKYFDVPNVVGTYAYPRGLESVSANAAFMADLYADFGWWGVLLGGVVAGFIMQCAQIYALRRRKTIGTVALFAFLIVIFWLLNSTSLPIVLASDGAILSMVVVWYLDRPTQSGLVPVRA
jgi:oligosaccharide repeat unit polymerase